jgi:PAS domain S-box-containing protein
LAKVAEQRELAPGDSWVLAGAMPEQESCGQIEQALLDGLQAMNQGAAIYDGNNILIAFNECYRQIFPTVSSQIRKGMSYGDLMRLFWNAGAAPEIPRDQWVRRLENEFRTFGEPILQRVPDGHYHKTVKRPLPDNGVLSIFQDFTKPEKESGGKHVGRELFDDLARATADWFWETDADHRFVMPSGNLDFSKGLLPEFLGRTRWEAVGVDPDKNQVWADHRNALLTHRPFRDFRYKQVLRGGEVRHSRISGVPRFDGDNRFIGYWGVGIDETALMEADDRALAAEKYAQEAVDSLEEGITLHDPDGSLVLWNRKFQAIYGSDALHLERGLSFEQLVTRLGNTGEIDHQGLGTQEWIRKRLALPRPNPNPVDRLIHGRWYQISEAATPSGGHAILMTDISEMKQQQSELIKARDNLEARVEERTRSLADAVAKTRSEAIQRNAAEARLQDSEQKFRSIAEGAIQGFYVLHDFNLVYANPAFATLLGYDAPEELIEIGNLAELLAPSVRDELIQRYQDRVTGKTPPPRYETRFLHKNGEEIWAELFVSPITWEGQISVLASAIDIDSRKRAEEARAEAESDYRAIFEHASDGIYRSSLEGKNLRANPALARMNGFEDEEDVRGSDVDLEGSWYVEPGRREEFVNTMNRDGEVRNFVSEVYRYKSRTRMWISENARLIRDGDGEPLYFEGTVRDITEQRQVEMDMREAMAEAERANYAKSQFLAKMSHELRTPLNAIIGFSEIITNQMMGPVGTDRYVSYASDIHGSGRHLLSLINDLLDLSKIESGETPLDIQSLDLLEILQECASLMKPMASHRSISIRIETHDAPERVFADRRSLKQILLNLLSNAVKFNREGGWVSVRASQTKENCQIEVSDNGIGIMADDMHTLFTPFGQVGNQLVAENTGTGLGLPIVKSLVELHGGEISVRSEPGEGTTLIIELPLAA